MDRMSGDIYRGSNGRVYGDAQLWERFECGEWTPCCWDEDTGAEWVRTTDDELLALRPTSLTAIPAELTISYGEDGVRVVEQSLTGSEEYC